MEIHLTKEQLWELVAALKKIEEKNKHGYNAITVKWSVKI